MFRAASNTGLRNPSESTTKAVSINKVLMYLLFVWCGTPSVHRSLGVCSLTPSIALSAADETIQRAIEVEIDTRSADCLLFRTAPEVFIDETIPCGQSYNSVVEDGGKAVNLRS